MFEQYKVIAVTGVSGDVGLGVVESIRIFSPQTIIIGFDQSDVSYGAALVDEFVRIVSVKSEEYAHVLAESVDELKVEKVISGIDGELETLLSLNLPAGLWNALISCELSLLSIFGSKFQTSQWLSERGFDFPESILIDSECQLEEVVSDEDKESWIIKPDRGNGSRGVQVVKDCKIGKTVHPTPNSRWCVQELLSGPEFTASAVFSISGELSDLFVMRRWLVGGRTVAAEVCADESVIRYVWQIALSMTGAAGPVNFQLINDANKGPTVFEVNPRFSGSTQIRTALGFNEYQIMLSNQSVEIDQIIAKHEALTKTFAYRKSSVVVAD